jgi:hypothetical protein
MAEKSERIAKPGQLWLCGACGRLSEDRFGLVGWHTHGWDEACALNSILVSSTDKDGKAMIGHKPEERYLRRKPPDVGDQWDMTSLSGYDKSKNLSKDVE